jgi:hypothetical protein
MKPLSKLSKQALAEVTKLLERTEAGTITKVQLNRGVKQSEARLKQMLGQISGALGKVSRVKRGQTRTINTTKLKSRLKEAGREMEMMDFGNGWK